MAARLLSRVSFLFRATVQQNITGKVPKNISLFPRAPVQQNITIKALENKQVSYLSRIESTSAGEESQYERTSQSGRGVFLMVGGFALSSLNSETPKKSDEEVKRSSEKENLRDERGRFARTQPKPNGNLERRTRGIREWRAKRKLEFDRTEESPPPKRETRMSQVGFNFFSLLGALSNITKSFIRESFLCCHVIFRLPTNLFILAFVIFPK